MGAWPPGDPLRRRPRRRTLVFPARPRGACSSPSSRPGFGDDPIGAYHAPDVPPPHHYLAFYRWLDTGWGPTRSSMSASTARSSGCPARPTPCRRRCYPDAALGDVPLVYPFVVNDPGEGTQAKRRAHAVVIDHLVPPMTRAEAYRRPGPARRLLDAYANAQAMDPPSCPPCAGRCGRWSSTPTSTATWVWTTGLDGDGFDEMVSTSTATCARSRTPRSAAACTCWAPTRGRGAGRPGAGRHPAAPGPGAVAAGGGPQDRGSTLHGAPPRGRQDRGRVPKSRPPPSAGPSPPTACNRRSGVAKAATNGRRNGDPLLPGPQPAPPPPPEPRQTDAGTGSRTDADTGADGDWTDGDGGSDGDGGATATADDGERGGATAGATEATATPRRAARGSPSSTRSSGGSARLGTGAAGHARRDRQHARRPRRPLHPLGAERRTDPGRRARAAHRPQLLLRRPEGPPPRCRGRWAKRWPTPWSSGTSPRRAPARTVGLVAVGHGRHAHERRRRRPGPGPARRAPAVGRRLGPGDRPRAHPDRRAGPAPST